MYARPSDRIHVFCGFWPVVIKKIRDLQQEEVRYSYARLPGHFGGRELVATLELMRPNVVL